RLVAEVLSAASRAVREHAAQRQDALRLRLSADHARALDGRVREAPHQDGSAPAHHERECGAAAQITLSESQALTLAGVSAVCFGTALVSAKFGLRTVDARSGAAISIPTATALLVLAAPFALDASGFTLAAALIF